MYFYTLLLDVIYYYYTLSMGILCTSMNAEDIVIECVIVVTVGLESVVQFWFLFVGGYINFGSQAQG